MSGLVSFKQRLCASLPPSAGLDLRWPRVLGLPCSREEREVQKHSSFLCCSGAFCAMELQASCSPMFFCSHPQRGPCTSWFCSVGLEPGRGPCPRCSVVTMVTAEAGVLGSDSPGVCIRSEGFSWSLLPPSPLAGLLQTSPSGRRQTGRE